MYLKFTEYLNIIFISTTLTDTVAIKYIKDNNYILEEILKYYNKFKFNYRKDNPNKPFNPYDIKDNDYIIERINNILLSLKDEKNDLDVLILKLTKQINDLKKEINSKCKIQIGGGNKKYKFKIIEIKNN